MSKRICAEIDLNAILFNIRQIKNKAKGKKLIAVIKANAYGHGDERVASFIEAECDMFAVAAAEEALHLRKCGIKKDIIVLSMVPDEDKEGCIKNNIILTVSDLAEGEKISRAADKLGMRAAIHAAVDTGMNRIGFKANDRGIEEIKRLSRLSNVSVTGIFSHYAVSDIKDKTFTVMQTERFGRVCDAVGEGRLCHIANSAAIMELEATFGGAVRAGIIVYGLLPSDVVDAKALALKPALTLKSRVSFVKEIEKGEGVSYGLTFVADKKMKIATVSAGYADGYPRLLSGKGTVLIRGRRYSIVGRICMDQFMIDVTGSDVKVDDEVILIGQSGDEYISADEVAHLANTINYEIICSVGMRVPREYKKTEGKK